MRIQIGGYSFDGPFETWEELQDNCGIFAVLSSQDGLGFAVIDIDETAKIKTCLQTGVEQKQWQVAPPRKRFYAVYYTPHYKPKARQQIKNELRQNYNLP